MLYQALPQAIGFPGIGELWPILVVVLLLFGAKKLPELARAMGSSINQFKKGLDDEKKRGELPRKSECGDGDPGEDHDQDRDGKRSDGNEGPSSS